jgi:uncharacterized protein YkwD
MLTAALLAALTWLLLTRAAGPAGPQNAFAVSCPGEDTSVVSLSVGQLNDAIKCLINETRASAGRSTLSTQSQLQSAANFHTSDMQANSLFQHNSSDGTSFKQRVRSFGYFKNATRFQAGEIMGQGTGASVTPQDVLNVWLNSTSHSVVIYKKKFKNIGVASAHGSFTNPGDANGSAFTVNFGFHKK